MNPIFLNMKISDIQPNQGLSTAFTFQSELQNLTITELTLAIKLWSKRIQTINLNLEKLNQKMPDDTVLPHITKFESELTLITQSFKQAIIDQINQVIKSPDPSVPFSQLILLSQQLENSLFPHFELNNLLAEFYIGYCKNTNLIQFKSAKNQSQYDEIFAKIDEIDLMDHWKLTGAGAALFATGAKTFTEVLTQLISLLEIDTMDIKTYKLITVYAEQLKMFKISHKVLTDTDFGHIYTVIVNQLLRIQNNQNVYIYIFTDNLTLHPQTQQLDLFHQASWSALSSLYRILPFSQNLTHFDSILPIYHNDSLLNFSQTLETVLGQNLCKIQPIYEFFVQSFDNPRLPIQRRCGCIPYVFSAIWRVMGRNSMRNDILEKVGNLKQKDTIQSKFALRSLFRERIIDYKGKKLSQKEDIIDVILFSIESCQDDYLVRNSSFQLYSCSLQQLFMHSSVSFKEISIEVKQRLFKCLCIDNNNNLLMALSFLSYFKPGINPDLEFIQRLELIEQTNQNSSIQLLVARNYQIFFGTKNAGIEHIIKNYQVSGCKILAIRQMLRGFKPFKLGRGHSIFSEEKPEKIQPEVRQQIILWGNDMKEYRTFQLLKGELND